MSQDFQFNGYYPQIFQLSLVCTHFLITTLCHALESLSDWFFIARSYIFLLRDSSPVREKRTLGTGNKRLSRLAWFSGGQWMVYYCQILCSSRLWPWFLLFMLGKEIDKFILLGNSWASVVCCGGGYSLVGRDSASLRCEHTFQPILCSNGRLLISVCSERLQNVFWIISGFTL